MADWTPLVFETEEAWEAAKAQIRAESPYEGERFVPFEENPERHVYQTGAIKDNRSKPRVDLLPSLPLIEIAKVLTYGARKYKPNNWRFGLPWGDTYASMQRHLLAWQNREDTDPETGISHLAHAGCQLLFLLEYELTRTGTDDRWTASRDGRSGDQNTNAVAGLGTGSADADRDADDLTEGHEGP